MPKRVITIKDHGAVEPDNQWVQYTIYRGVFPKREVVGYANTAENAELIAQGLVGSGTISRVFGKPDKNW